MISRLRFLSRLGALPLLGMVPFTRPRGDHMVTLNVPGSAVQLAGPSPVAQPILVSDVNSANGGTNLFQTSIGGFSSFLWDGSYCYADILVQVFMQDSPVGQPFVMIMRAGEKKVVRFGAAVDFLVLSNASGTFALPLGASLLISPRQPRNTGGYILVSGIDTDVEIDESSPLLAEVVLDRQLLTPGQTWSKTYQIPPGAESLLLTIPFPADVTQVSITEGSGLTLYSSSTPSILTAIPLPRAGNDQVTFTITGTGSSVTWSLIARRDSVLNVASTGVPISGTVTTLAAAQATASRNSAFHNVAAFVDTGAPFARPNNLYSFSAAAQMSNNPALGAIDQNIAFCGLKGTTSGNRAYFIALNLSNPTQMANATYFQGSAAYENLYFPSPIDLTKLFPGDANLDSTFAYYNGSLQPVVSMAWLTS